MFRVGTSFFSRQRSAREGSSSRPIAAVRQAMRKAPVITSRRAVTRSSAVHRAHVGTTSIPANAGPRARKKRWRSSAILARRLVRLSEGSKRLAISREARDVGLLSGSRLSPTGSARRRRPCEPCGQARSPHRRTTVSTRSAPVHHGSQGGHAFCCGPGTVPTWARAPFLATAVYRQRSVRSRLFALERETKSHGGGHALQRCTVPTWARA